MQTAPDLTDASLYNEWSEDTIRFGDMDATGHVNNVAFARYVESGRVPFMRSDIIPAYDETQRFVVGHLSIHFRAQAFWPGTVRIGTAVAKLGRTSITLGHGLFVEGKCIATAETMMVYIVEGRASPLPERVRTELERLVAG